MQIDVSFRHMEPSDTLRDYADEKLRRVIRKHIRDDFDAQITLSVEKFRHIAKILLSYKGISIKCEEQSEDMYQSIDLALDKLERQIRRYKDKLRTHKPDRVDASRTLSLSVVSVDESESAIIADDAEEVVEEILAATATARILKHETLTITAMSVDDAIMKLQLELLPVIVFVNEETKSTNVLYKQENGTFGIIAFD
ncbi:MAG: ribosome-associated translation inhibitor RaiA [Proteobacteria bacterium]|nr:ribosome-associated translation inhibitor RaiA [Pseudomonadota bacterium]